MVFDPVGVLLTAITIGTGLAGGFAVFSSKRKDETIATLERLVSAMRDEHEFTEAAMSTRIATLEGRVDALQSEFAASIATAIVSALPEAWSKWEDRHEK